MEGKRKMRKQKLELAVVLSLMLAAAAKKLMAVIKTTCGKLLKFFTDHVNFHPSQCHRYSAGVKHSLPTTFERSITMQISSALYF